MQTQLGSVVSTVTVLSPSNTHWQQCVCLFLTVLFLLKLHQRRVPIGLGALLEEHLLDHASLGSPDGVLRGGERERPSQHALHVPIEVPVRVCVRLWTE